MGELTINVPPDRDATYNPIIIPKRKNMVNGLEHIIVSLYAKGMCNRDIEYQIRDIYNFDVYASNHIKALF